MTQHIVHVQPIYVVKREIGACAVHLPERVYQTRGFWSVLVIYTYFFPTIFHRAYPYHISTMSLYSVHVPAII